MGIVSPLPLIQEKVGPIEGVVGSVEYVGPIEEFLPLICMGQLTHLGKQAVFGLGRYRIIERCSES